MTVLKSYGAMTFKGYVKRYNSQWQFMAQQHWNNVATIQNNATTMFLGYKLLLQIVPRTITIKI